MLTLFRTESSSRADEIQERLEAMVAAHKVRPASEFDGPSDALPVLDDSGDRYAGDAIDAFLLTLESELKTSRAISADACFIDPKTNETC